MQSVNPPLIEIECLGSNEKGLIVETLLTLDMGFPELKSTIDLVSREATVRGLSLKENPPEVPSCRHSIKISGKGHEAYAVIYRSALRKSSPEKIWVGMRLPTIGFLYGKNAFVIVVDTDDEHTFFIPVNRLKFTRVNYGDNRAFRIASTSSGNYRIYEKDGSDISDCVDNVDMLFGDYET